MELWIRSQDKNCLIPINDIISVFQESVFYKGIILGQYKTKERALEVLGEIHKILKPQLIIKDSGKIIGSFDGTIIREGANYELKELSTYVYEMPKE